MTDSLRLQLSNEAPAVILALDCLELFCVYHRIARPVCDQLALGTVEALNNVLEHAYAGCAGQRIDIRFVRRPDDLLIEIRDCGRPMRAPLNTHLPEPMSERGRGWPIINACMDAVSIERLGRTNILRLQRFL